MKRRRESRRNPRPYELLCYPNRIRLTSVCRPRLGMDTLDKSLERRENRRNQWGLYERDRLISLLIVRSSHAAKRRMMDQSQLSWIAGFISNIADDVLRDRGTRTTDDWNAFAA